ncbi:MAG TPA: hypothetical protein PL195_04430 [bacterium]|nr:hypothetical protein [bacterium]
MLVFFAIACGSDPKVGEEGGKCFEDNTCKGKLKCVEDFCVDLGDMTDYPDVDSHNDIQDNDAVSDDDNENGGENPDLIDECDFSIEVMNKKDLDSIVNCRVITGELIIEETDLEEVVLPNLEEVRDYFDIFENPKLKKISMPKLEYAGSIFGIDMNPLLTEINFSKLNYVADNIVVWGNDSLKTLSFPSLKKADEGIYIDFNKTLESIDAPLLESVKEFIEFDHNDSLRSFSFPVLESALGLSISRNSVLETFDMALFYDVQEIFIVLNPQLPTGKAEALIEQIKEKGTSSYEYEICGNKDGTKCDFDWEDLD